MCVCVLVRVFTVCACVCVYVCVHVDRRKITDRVGAAERPFSMIRLSHQRHVIGRDIGHPSLSRFHSLRSPRSPCCSSSCFCRASPCGPSRSPSVRTGNITACSSSSSSRSGSSFCSLLQSLKEDDVVVVDAVAAVCTASDLVEGEVLRQQSTIACVCKQASKQPR